MVSAALIIIIIYNNNNNNNNNDMVLVLTRFKGSALIFYLPGLRWAKGSSPDKSSQRQSEKLNISALILYLVHWVKTSGAIQRRFYKNK